MLNCVKYKLPVLEDAKLKQSVSENSMTGIKVPNDVSKADSLTISQVITRRVA